MTSEPLPFRNRRRGGLCWLASFVVGASLLLSPGPASGDQVEMQNGDRYAGRVLSLDTNLLVLQSDVMGTVRLPRAQVALIQFGARKPAAHSDRAATTNRLAAAPMSGASPEIAAALKQLGAKTNFIQQIQKQFLSDAGPEANQHFNDLVSGLLSGKMTVNDLRAQAKSVADQLRTAQKELGSEAGWAVDSYLAILDHFLNETAPASAPASNGAKGR